MVTDWYGKGGRSVESERAIQRTAPALLALFSMVTLFAHPQMAKSAESNPTNGLVPQELSDLLRRLGAGAQRAVGLGGDFLGVAPRVRYSKSSQGICATANRRGLATRPNG